MEQKLYVSGCPVCGRSLFKGISNSYIECNCPKCKNYIKIKYTDTGFMASVAQPLDKTSNKEYTDTSI